MHLFHSIHKNTSSTLQSEYITVTESPLYRRHNTDCSTADWSYLALPLFWLHILNITFTNSLRFRYVIPKFSQYFAIYCRCKEHFWTNFLGYLRPYYCLCVSVAAFSCFLVLITSVTCTPGLSANADSYKSQK